MNFKTKNKHEASSAAAGKRRTKGMVAILITAAVLGGGAAGHLYFGQRQVPADGQVQTAAVDRGSIIRTLTGTGTLAPIEQFKITPLVTGKVLECTFEEGAQVEKGQLLYRIDPSEAQKSIEQAQLSLRQAQLSSSQQAEELEGLRVKAEQSGVVTEVFVKAGDKVDAGAKLAAVRNSADMLLTIPFNADDAARFAVGQTAKVTVSGSFETITGTVKEVDVAETVGAGFQVTRNVTITVPNPGALSPAASGTAQIDGTAGNSGAAFTYSAESLIHAGVSGRVEQLNLKKGASVAAGEVVARLSSTALRSQKENNSIAVQQAQVSLKNAEAGLEHYNITAPISGTVVTREVKAGDSLGSGSGTSSMAVIYDLSALIFTIPLDELDVSKVAVGQPVEVRVDALEGRAFQGTVTRISMAGSTDKGKTAYPVTVKIDAPPRELLPGMNVNASIVVAKADDVLTVPITAVQFGDVVFVRNKAGESAPREDMGAPEGFHSVNVETGISDGTNVEIKSGLQEGDEVHLPAEAAGPAGGDDYAPGAIGGEGMSDMIY